MSAQKAIDALTMIEGESRAFSESGNPLLTVFREIAAERLRQAAKHPEAGEHDVFLLCAVLGEETGEVQKAALDLRWALLQAEPKVAAEAETALRDELIQVAATAVKMIELLDAERLVIYRDDPAPALVLQPHGPHGDIDQDEPTEPHSPS